MTDTDHLDGHRLPSLFGAVDTASDASRILARAPRRRHPGVWLGLAAALVVVGLVAGGQLWANLHYDEAATMFAQASAEAGSAHRDLTESLRSHRGTLDAAVRLRGADAGLLTSAEARDELGAAIDAAEAEIAAASEAASEPLPRTPEKPFWPWELLAGAGDLDHESDAAQSLTVALRDAEDGLEFSIETIEDAAEYLIGTAAEAVAGFEERHISARNAQVIELRLARDDILALPSLPDAAAADAFEQLNAAASAVAASHDEVLASKAGSLLQRRLEVEEFARSIAGGVLLEFEWDRIVNGRGLNGSAGGLASWNSGHGGHATITLSNSVAQHWPSPIMRALVAHEVGHAISAKCYDMFDWEDRDANEEWATAWAISMGHTSEGNGVSIYGYPRQEIIDKARTCR